MLRIEELNDLMPAIQQSQISWASMGAQIFKWASSLFRVWRPAHSKVAEFRKSRKRQSDDDFLADCGVQNEPKSREIALAVRRAIAGVRLIDPLFIRASDRFPEEFSLLPLWDSMDWLAFVFELEEELCYRVRADPLYEWKFQNSFSVKQLVNWANEELRAQSGGSK